MRIDISVEARSAMDLFLDEKEIAGGGKAVANHFAAILEDEIRRLPMSVNDKTNIRIDGEKDVRIVPCTGGYFACYIDGRFIHVMLFIRDTKLPQIFELFEPRGRA